MPPYLEIRLLACYAAILSHADQPFCAEQEKLARQADKHRRGCCLFIVIGPNAIVIIRQLPFK
jgi:hypothetical protein